MIVRRFLSSFENASLLRVNRCICWRILPLFRST